MSRSQLPDLLRRYVETDEPPWPASPNEAVAQGRRSLRTRRAATFGGALSALVVLGVALVPTIAEPGGDVEDTAIDPATTKALDSFDAQQLPDLIDRIARPILERSIPDLGEGTFVAEDAQVSTLPRKWWDRASAVSLVFGDGTDHEVGIYLEHSRSGTEGDQERICEDELRVGDAFECEVSVLPSGDIAVSTLTAARPARDLPPGISMGVTRDELATVDPAELSFIRTVQVVKSPTFATYVRETVRAPSPDEARAALQVPVSDLVGLAADPRLVIPEPADDPVSGCAGFVVPRSGVTCEQN